MMMMMIIMIYITDFELMGVLLRAGERKVEGKEGGECLTSAGGGE